MRLIGKAIFSFLYMGLLFTTNADAANCFIASENGKIIKQEGLCTKRASPCSTFKIPLSLMGYNEGILQNEMLPELPYSPVYAARLSHVLEQWKQPHTPTLWIKNSCVWYSHLLTLKLGTKKFTDYVRAFDYGNHDLSGDHGKNNGLTNAWLSSSLLISPMEQIVFLSKLISSSLPVSQQAQVYTRNILYVEDLPNGWKLYGKTGSGSQLRPDHSRNKDRQIGWFIGWITKADRVIIFTQYLEDTQPETTYAGIRAKASAKEKLLSSHLSP